MGWGGRRRDCLSDVQTQPWWEGERERAYKTLPSPTFILRRVARGAKLLRRPLGAILAARKMRKNEESARLQFQDLPICIHCACSPV